MNNYYEDKTHLTNSMINDFVNIVKWWKKYYTPDVFYNLHIKQVGRLESTDVMELWKIVDEHFSEWVDVLTKYKVVDLRTKAGKEEMEANPDICVSQDIYNKIELLINALYSDDRYMRFLKDKNTISQVILQKEYEYADINWEIKTIKIKGKPDHINRTSKILVDLKTTANYEMLVEDMQWNLVPKIDYNYFRQLALYNWLDWWDNKCYLCIADYKNTYISKDNKKLWRVKWIFVPDYILKKSLESIFEDIRELAKYKDDKWEWDTEKFTQDLDIFTEVLSDNQEI